MNETPLSKVRPGRPPAELRDRVLGAAAGPAAPAARRRWTGFDLGLAASLLLLLLCHAALSLVPTHTGPEPVVAHRARPEPSVNRQLTLDAELVGIRLQAAEPRPPRRPLTLETVLRTTS